MPRPRGRLPKDQSALGQRLQEWMWSQRPPFTNGQVAYHVGVSSQVVWDWLNRGSIPTPPRLLALENLTGISLSEWYELAGYPVPSPPAPRQTRPIPPPETREEWIQRRIAETVEIVRESMRLKGKTEREIEEVVQAVPTVIRDRAEGTNRIRYIEHEWALPSPESVVEADSGAIAERPADYTEQPTQVLQLLQESKSQPPKPEQQERRAPRKRSPSPARKSPRSSPDR